MKLCTMCNQVKPLDEFYNRPDRENSTLCWCKVCRREYQRNRPRQSQLKRSQASEAKYKEKYPDRRKAKTAINNAVRLGKVPRVEGLLCRDCGKQAEQYHHESYEPDQWLVVVPLCRLCHGKTWRVR